MFENLPAELQDTLVTALQVLDHNSEAKLLPKYRWQIYDVIDHTMSDANAVIKPWISILSSRQVLPLWRVFWNFLPNANPMQNVPHWQRLPSLMVERAISVVQKTTDIEKEAFELWAHCQEVSALSGELLDSPYYREWCVFEAALETLRIALDPGAWQRDQLDDNITDAELGYYGDCAMFAVLAYAGGSWIPREASKWYYSMTHEIWLPYEVDYYDDDERGSWDDNGASCRQKRHHFWHWWLTEAIPAACNIGTMG